MLGKRLDNKHPLNTTILLYFAFIIFVVVYLIITVLMVSVVNCHYLAVVSFFKVICRKYCFDDYIIRKKLVS